jgi:rod shape-determining protein MreC
VLRLSVPLRLALARLTLPLLVAAAFATMLLGKADTVLVERVRMAMADLLAPVHAVVSEPIGAVRGGIAEIQGLVALRSDNARLREENERLRRWQAAALALEQENTTLRRMTGFVAEPMPAYRTARVVADAGGVYARAVLLRTGPEIQPLRGQVAMDERGLVGRVTEVGTRSARILLVTDLNSRIPVVLEGSGARAVMAGTNGPRPRLQHWPEGTRPAEGQRVVTLGDAGTVPGGLPVGVVRWTGSGAAEVELYARLDRLDLVRLFELGLSGILPPEAVARPQPRGRR